MLEQDLKCAGIGPGAEDDVPGLGAVVIAQREALEPAEHLVADPSQAAKSHADREVHVPGADSGVGQMERQRRRDDRHELAGLCPLGHLAR